MRREPKKRLGQNFLIDPNIRRKIIAACQLQKADTIVEIGAGQGALSGLIASKVDTLYALEIDQQLCVILKSALKEFPNARILNQDILKFDLRRYFAKSGQKIKVVGNIPYYITSPIIAHLLEHRRIINKVFLTVQKEFAERLCAKPGSKDYGAFSCFVQYYAKPGVLFTIKRTCFFPVPKVDSSFVVLETRRAPAVIAKDEKYFFRIIRAAFNQRRKTLRNSLKGLVGEEKLALFFEKFNILRTRRPEDLSLQDFANLANL